MFRRKGSQGGRATDRPTTPLPSWWYHFPTRGLASLIRLLEKSVRLRTRGWTPEYGVRDRNPRRPFLVSDSAVLSTQHTGDPSEPLRTLSYFYRFLSRPTASDLLYDNRFVSPVTDRRIVPSETIRGSTEIPQLSDRLFFTVDRTL